MFLFFVFIVFFVFLVIADLGLTFESILEGHVYNYKHAKSILRHVFEHDSDTEKHYVKAESNLINKIFGNEAESVVKSKDWKDFAEQMKIDSSDDDISMDNEGIINELYSNVEEKEGFEANNDDVSMDGFGAHISEASMTVNFGIDSEVLTQSMRSQSHTKSNQNFELMSDELASQYDSQINDMLFDDDEPNSTSEKPKSSNNQAQKQHPITKRYNLRQRK